jgi:outer membrane protein, heavy metal efflux system
MKARSVFGVVFIATALPASAQPAAGGWQVRLRDAMVRAVDRSPELTAMEARIAASRHRVRQAEALPDPEVELGIRDIPASSPSLTRDDFTMEMLSARQRFPGSGKLSTGKRAAEAEQDAGRAEHSRHVIEISADVADAFFRLGELDTRVAILEEARARLSDAAAAARERYGVGKAAQADVLRANLEKTALEDRLASLRAERRIEAARFNALQNLPAQTPVAPVVVPPDSEARIAANPVPSLADLLRQAERESPVVAAAEARVRRAEEEMELARLERRPDWSLAGYYARRENFEDLAGLSVSFNIPWVHPRRLTERRAERDSDFAGALADLAAVRNTLNRDIDQAYAELEKSREQVRLYRDSILPQAEINYRAAREAYGVGSIDFLTYVRAATDLSMYESERAERDSGVARALAMLQKASGIALIEGTPVREPHE